MEKHTGFTSVLVIALFLHQVTCQSHESVRGHGDVTIQATPTPVIDVMSGELTVNCSFTKVSGSTINQQMSLILSKTLSSGSLVYQTLATITSLSPDKIVVTDSLAASVTGQFSDNSSYIAYQWSDASNHAEGSYRCEAFGMDVTGHPSSSYDVIEVEAGSLDMNLLAEKFAILEKSNKALESRLNKVVGELHQKSCIETDLTSRLQAAQTFLTEAAFSYNGHRYLLSRPMFYNHPDAASRCKLFGGYLAEIDDSREFDALMNFTKAYNKERYYVALGGTDHGHEGNWTLLESGRPLNYTNFYPGEPNPGAEDCLFLSAYWQDKMVNYVCYESSWFRFLCEFEDQSTC